MRSTIVVLGFYFAAVICNALAQPGGAIAAAFETTHFMAAQDGTGETREPRLHDEWAQDDRHAKHDRAYGDFGDDEEYNLELAVQLSGLETRLGIRGEQLDAWRDYTAALQDLLAPIRPQKRNDPRDYPQGDVHGPKDPFDREQKLADELMRRATAAERLNAAIAALRTTLTPQQLDELAAMNRPD